MGGRVLEIEAGLLAGQANGAVTVRYGDTIVLATAVMSEKASKVSGYFPLMVDFEERYYAAGRIKGSQWIKREGRPSDEAVLAGRMIDRSIRPLFDESSKKEIQVIITVLSYDGENEADITGLVAVSAALGMANIGWEGPISGVKVGRVDNKLVANPTIEQRENSDMDFPFCLVWANENWTRRWDGLENEVLISQIHTPEMDRDFIKDLEIYLQDDRYIRIKDRPVIIVYRLDSLPNPHRTVHIWRDYCINRHLGDPYLIAAQTFGFDDPKIVGFDAAVQFPPHNQFQDPLFRITSKIRKANPEYSSHIYSYSKIVDYVQENHRTPPYPLFKTAFPGWDNEPRRPGRGTVYAGSTPQLFKNWLRTIGEWTINHHPEDSRLVFINAWNEWAEGAHLEPDQKYGYAYLYATMNALKSLYIDKNT